MSWIAVDFSRVRYSPIEGTHWFYDPAYPSAIQFLLNGQWEPWDVAWVHRSAQDPELRRVAADAEHRLTTDHSSGSGHRLQPPTPPAHPDHHVNGHHQPPERSRSAHPPFPCDGETSAPAPQPYAQQTLPRSPLSPSSASSHSWRQTIPTPPAPQQPYVSPYAAQSGPAPQTTAQTQEPVPSPQQPLNSPTINGEQVPAHAPTGPNVPDTPAPALSLVRNRDTKILLSLDGDGVRGLTQVLLVESLVNAICTKIGHRVDSHQIFDLIGGVSNGGLLAILIGRMRMRLHRARQAYMSIARPMFWDKWRFFISLDPRAPPPEENEHSLEESIKEVIAGEGEGLDQTFFDQRTDSAHIFVISTKVEIGSNQAAIIRSYPTRRMAGPELDANLTTWQAAHATLAAPRYVDASGGRRAVVQPGLVDYGTSKNNPIRDLFYECRKLYSYANDTMVVVSIGTGSGFDRSIEVPEMTNILEDRTSEAKVAGEKFELDMQDLRDRGWMKYFRFNVPDLDDVPLQEFSQLDRLMAKTHAYLAVPEIGEQFYACVNTIAGVVTGDPNVWPKVMR